MFSYDEDAKLDFSALNTKLCGAAAKGDLKEVEQLVKLGANPSIGDYDNRTPYHLAAGNNFLRTLIISSDRLRIAEGHIHVLEYLISLPMADINVVDRFGGTPLSDAMRHNRADILDWLVAHGAKLESKKMVDGCAT